MAPIGHPEVVLASADDRERGIATQVAAFVGDPFNRWMFPDAQQYLAVFPQVLEHFAGGAFEWGTAWRSADHTGHALWQPPGVGPDDDALTAVMIDALGGDRLAEVGAVFEQIGPLHPEGDHWYLRILGVDPAAQGRGIGAALLAASLAVVDESHLPAFLESTNPRNVGLYVRLGFEPLAEISVAGSPVMTPMLRPAR
jgi:GNAT superfamily N-acetyltransferase